MNEDMFQKCQSHENSEEIQCYSELDGSMLRPEVYEIFKSPKPFQYLAGSVILAYIFW